MARADEANGGCLCGGVRYRVAGPLEPVLACHCTQCARTSGHFVAMTRARRADVVFEAEGTLAWYVSSDTAERGFCTRCGGNLFYRHPGGPNLSIAAGTLDRPTGLAIVRHIHVASKSDYYEIGDGLPQSPEGGTR